VTLVLFDWFTCVSSGIVKEVGVGELPSGTVTFLFTDLEGSTRLWEEHRDAMQSALARHDAVLRSAVESHGGRVVKTTGDGLHAVFGTAPDATAAAVDAQQRLLGEVWPLPEPLRVRMGLHTGHAEMRDGDYFGPAVNRAARVAAAAHGGQIVMCLVRSPGMVVGVRIGRVELTAPRCVGRVGRERRSWWRVLDYE
jgi:class 3 adenylate cyclase